MNTDNNRILQPTIRSAKAILWSGTKNLAHETSPLRYEFARQY